MDISVLSLPLQIPPLLNKPQQLSPEFNVILALLEETNRHFFITGKAGTGKSTLLQIFRKSTKKKVVVLSPTGLSALNVGGQTIHSFFGFPITPLTPGNIHRSKNQRMYQKLDAIIIDEISMVRADILDQISWFMRVNGKSPGEPFGGVQLIFFGDLFQLPPVVVGEEEKHRFKTEYESPYFFSSKEIREVDLEVFELRQVYRQTERRFLSLLDAVRTNEMDEELLEDINTRHKPNEPQEEGTIILTARNATADEINKKKMDELPTISKTYYGTQTGDFNLKLLPVEMSLVLKVGAQVIFVKNDADRRFVNGTIGKVVELLPESVKVRIEDNESGEKVIEIGPLAWETHRYSLDEKGNFVAQVIGSYAQIPLKPAWAITIHKSQGQTFERCIIDIGKGAFEFGQTYVALSRCKTFEGLTLRNKLTPRDVFSDERIVEYYDRNR